MLKIIHYLAAAGAMLSAISANAATVQYDGSEVIGVSDLVFDGGIYDAIFTLGSYNDVLANYPSPAYETNYTYQFAEAATWALYGFAITDTGFAGISLGDIRGCESTAASCYLSTTVEQNSLTAWSFAYKGNATVWSGPNYYPFHIFPNVDVDHLTHVVWVQTGVVPVPAAFWLFGSALLALAAAARRNHPDLV